MLLVEARPPEPAHASASGGTPPADVNDPRSPATATGYHDGVMRILGAIVALLVVLAIGAFLLAGRAVPPAIQITQPTQFVGQDGTLELLVTSPKGELSKLDVALEQNGQRVPLGRWARRTWC